MSRPDIARNDRSFILGRCSATGKVRFGTEGAAKANMLSIKTIYDLTRHRASLRHRNGRPAQKRSYYCVHCAGYHLTSWDIISSKKQKEKKAKQVFIAEHVLGLIR